MSAPACTGQQLIPDSLDYAAVRYLYPMGLGSGMIRKENMIIKQKVITEKQFLRPKEVSEKEWIDHWRKYPDGLPPSDDDFYKYHMEDSSSDVEVLETTFVWNETGTQERIPFTDEAIEKLQYKDIKDKKKKTNGIKVGA